jgi:hypothetical protein
MKIEHMIDTSTQSSLVPGVTRRGFIAKVMKRVIGGGIAIGALTIPQRALAECGDNHTCAPDHCYITDACGYDSCYVSDAADKGDHCHISNTCYAGDSCSQSNQCFTHDSCYNHTCQNIDDCQLLNVCSAYNGCSLVDRCVTDECITRDMCAAGQHTCSQAD